MLDQSHVCIPWDATRGKTGEGGAGGAWEWLRKSRNGCSGSRPSCLSDGGKGELADLPSVCSKIPIKTPEHFPDRSKDRAQQLCLSLEKNKKKPKFIQSLFSSPPILLASWECQEEFLGFWKSAARPCTFPSQEVVGYPWEVGEKPGMRMKWALSDPLIWFVWGKWVIKQI